MKSTPISKKKSTSSKKPKGSVLVHERRKYDKAWLKAESERLGLTGVKFLPIPLVPKS